MPAAVIGGAIAAVGGIGSAVIASSGASKAAKASQAASDNSASVQQQMYNQSAAALSPYQKAGLPATNAINALLGIGGSPASQPQNFAGTAQIGGPMEQQYGEQFDGLGNDLLQSPNQIGGVRDRWGDGSARWSGASHPTAQPMQQQQQPTQQQSYDDAFGNYRNSTGYQFRLNQGMDAINSGYAGASSIKSGAAIRAANDYGQGMASQEFGNYLGALGNQQSLGFSAASAQAGVGQNYANSLSNIYQQNGANQANAALVRSQNTANALGGVANTAGYLYGRYG